ncbi:MAG: Membrane fusion component of tripartite multidrug resistance system [Devosia sp.]|uniref:HlyD family secretion protein n=1 Tax=Devosia sp. TaxID=1871048 RepID=UPI002619009A|nr:HlyD family secretion protein [Devosia sp.]MDB5540042.1 Membrane fusion component of tripartite multidrug resistance system [Devosia sp.]
MNARVTTPAPGEAKPVSIPVAEMAKPEAVVAPTPPAKKKRSGRRLALMLSVPVVLAVGGGYFWLTGGRYVDTDNAYVQQPKVSVSSDVAGRIVSVAVKDNQVVKAGDTLFAIDPEPYRIALSQADAALATARVNVEQLRVGLGTATAKLDAAKATLAIRQKEWDRSSNLQKQGISAESALDDSRLALQQAQSNVSLEEQDVANATAALGGDPNVRTDDHPAVRAALAARDNAQRNLDKSTVVAPADGIVSQVASLNVGQFIATGSTIATLVETGDTWIEANFKETQLTGLSVGMPAEISVDAFPGTKLKGHVDSIGAATGAEFALIPAQNATGNWVKVVQRVPVRIAVDNAAGESLVNGMSAVVSVDTKPELSAPEVQKAL